GVQGFVRWLEQRDYVTSPRRARMLPWIIGCIIFIESNITVLVAGAIGRPLIDRYRVSREKLAYLIDSTSAPICILIPLNAWGAYVLGILNELGVADPLGVFAGSIPVNFYAISALLLSGTVAYTGWAVGPMKKAEERTRGGQVLSEGAQPMIDPDVISPDVREDIPRRMRNMIVPIATLVLMMPVGLLITGNGDITAGSGSTSVLWAVLAALAVAWVMLVAQRIFTVNELTQVGLKGAGGLVGLALVLLLALALGGVTRDLGTGQYVANLTAGLLPPYILLPLTFLLAPPTSSRHYSFLHHRLSRLRHYRVLLPAVQSAAPRGWGIAVCIHIVLCPSGPVVWSDPFRRPTRYTGAAPLAHSEIRQQR